MLTDHYKRLQQSYLGTNSEPHQAMINIILWGMGNLKWPNPYKLNVCVKWRWANSHHKDHIALSYILAFQTQCNLRQKLVFQYPQSTQLKSNSFMLSLIPSELCFKALGSQNEFKITKRNANQSTTNHLTGALEENFIATDINHLLITDPILLTDNMWLSSHNLEPQRGKSNPNNLHIALRKNALKWLTFPKVIRPKRWVLLFQDSFPPDPQHMVSITARPWPQRHFKSLWKMWFHVSCPVVCHKEQLKFWRMRGRGKG